MPDRKGFINKIMEEIFGKPRLYISLTECLTGLHKSFFTFAVAIQISLYVALSTGSLIRLLWKDSKINHSQRNKIYSTNGHSHKTNLQSAVSRCSHWIPQWKDMKASFKTNNPWKRSQKLLYCMHRWAHHHRPCVCVPRKDQAFKNH